MNNTLHRACIVQGPMSAHASHGPEGGGARPISVLRFWISEGHKQKINSKGWNSHVHREFPGSFEPRNPSRDNLNREIGRMSHHDALCMYIYIYIYIERERERVTALGRPDCPGRPVRDLARGPV